MKAKTINPFAIRNLLKRRNEDIAILRDCIKQLLKATPHCLRGDVHEHVRRIMKEVK